MTAITGPDIGASTVHDMVVRRTALYSLSPQQPQLVSTTPPNNIINFSSPHTANKTKSAHNLHQIGGGASTIANNTSGNSMVIGCWQKPYHHSSKSKQIRNSNSTDCLDDPRTSQTNKSHNEKEYDKSLMVPKTDDELLDIITDSSNKYAFRRGRLIGKGGFAKVYEVTDLTVNSQQPGVIRVFADKVINKEVFSKRSTSKDKVKREIQLHKDLNHPNVVQFHKFFHDEANNVHIILEYCSMKSLLHVMKARKVLTEPEVRYYMKQICEGVRYIHHRHILHRDLKLGNMFLTADMTLKIGDFGLATTFPPELMKTSTPNSVGSRPDSKGGNTPTTSTTTTLCGTPNYIAPEVLRKQGHGIEADVWALGCMMYAMLVGTPPFETKSLGRTYAKIAANDYEIPERLSDCAHECIRTLLHPDPFCRGNLNQSGHPNDLLMRPFFTRGFCPTLLPTSATSQPPVFPLENLYDSRNSLKDSLSPQVERRMSSKSHTVSSSPASSLSNDDTDSGCSGLSSTTNPATIVAKHLQQNINTSLSAGDILRQRFEQLFGIHDSKNIHKREHLLIQIIEAIEPVLVRGCGMDLVDGVSSSSSHRYPEPLSLLPIFVSKWIDYSNKYGFGYQLSDQSVGVIFNDSTRICRTSDGAVVEFTDQRGKMATFPSYSPPPELSTRVRLVEYFGRYMEENLAEGVTSSLCVNQMCVTTRHKTMIPQVVRWIRNHSTVIMELNNSSIQINFIKDHAKLVFWGASDISTFPQPSSNSFLVTYLSADRVPITYNLRTLSRNSLPTAIESKISTALDVLKELTEKLLDKYSEP
jgi:polo-like kinase 2